MTEPALRHERDDHRFELKHWLRDLPDLAALLSLFRMAGSTPPDPDQTSTKSPNPSKSPLNLAVLDLEDTRDKDWADPTRTDYDIDRMAGARRQGLLPTLASWTRRVDENRPQDRQPELNEDPTVTSECGYLLAHLDWIVDEPYFSELHDDIKAIRRDVRHAIGDRDPSPLICGDCDWEVFFDSGVFKCSGCRKVTGVLEAARLAERAKPKMLRECAKVVKVSERTLRTLVARKRLKPVAMGYGKTRLYDIKDVTIALASDRILGQTQEQAAGS